MARLAMVRDQIVTDRTGPAGAHPKGAANGPNAMVRSVGQRHWRRCGNRGHLVQEVLSRNLRDRRAVARYAGLTGSPDESGSKRREKGLAKAGNARVRRRLVQLAWRFLMFQKDSALAQWYRPAPPFRACARPF